MAATFDLYIVKVECGKKFKLDWIMMHDFTTLFAEACPEVLECVSYLWYEFVLHLSYLY